jgi:hypothetical protein
MGALFIIDNRVVSISSIGDFSNVFIIGFDIMNKLVHLIMSNIKNSKEIENNAKSKKDIE